MFRAYSGWHHSPCMFLKCNFSANNTFTSLAGGKLGFVTQRLTEAEMTPTTSFELSCFDPSCELIDCRELSNLGKTILR